MGRCGNGEGAIYQDADGRWRAVVNLGWINGRRTRKYLSGRTRFEVSGKLRRLLDQQANGVDLAAMANTPTVEAWLTYWVDNIAARRVRPSRLNTYRAYIRRRIVPNLGRHRLDKLQPEHLEALYRRLQDEDGLAPASVLQCHRILSRALKVAVQRGRIGRNVATLVDAPSVQREEVTPLSLDEARAVLAVAEGRRNAARWTVALGLGLRQGEALGLAWDAVDLDEGTLTVRQALQRQRGQGFVLIAPKSRAGRRTIALPSPLVEALRAHRAEQLAERMRAANCWRNEHDLVFTTEMGTPIDPRADHREWQDLLKEAGLSPRRLHDARHTAATVLLSQGVPARVVMEVLGHSQVTLTLGTYSHVMPELARDAANRMADALWG